MLSMQSNEIKARFSEVLRKVEAGQEIVISRHGKPIARLSPWQQNTKEQSERIQAVEKMKHFRKHKLGKGESIAEMREAGQR